MSSLLQSLDATTGIDTDLPRQHLRRSPAAVVVVSLIAGILIDRWLGLPVLMWTSLAVISVMTAWAVRRRRPGTATIALLLAGAAIGGLRHHLSWWAVASDDISRLLLPDPRPVRVTGIVESPIVILGADDSSLTPAWMQVDRSMCEVRCEAVRAGERTHAVSGRARLMVSGHLLHADVGDRIEVAGQLISPSGPTNPGAFDYRDYLRRRGVRTQIVCDHPDAVHLESAAVAGHFQRWRSNLRRECEQVFADHLGPRTAPLASSLLLGERSSLPSDVQDAFVQSGTMHLLAISGLHVGLLAGLLLVCCRLLNVPLGATAIAVLVGVVAFACITNLRPPVVRASVLATVVAAGWPMYRSAGGTNLIALCGLVVLLINPTDLFDIGTQLSFLAVIAIGWSADFIARQRQSIDQESLLPRLFADREGIVHRLVRFLAEAYVVTLMIWLFTLPLTAAAFHVAAPVGFVVNVLLIPWTAVVLWLGFVTMLVGLLLPWVVVVPAVLFDWSLRGLLAVVDRASALELGHASVAGPSTAWLVLFYSLLAAVLLWRRREPVRRWGWSAVWGWIIVGQLVALLPERRDSLRCTVLDVGHGCCVVLQLPGGQNLLYDAGMLAGEVRGRQVIESALWELGVRRIDAIVVSHADIDHFSAVAGLMQTIPVGTILCSRQFLDFEQEPVAAVCEAAAQSGVPMTLLHEGDQLRLRDQVIFRVLHPPPMWDSKQDNASSLVCGIEFDGRTILLTGDLEQEGLDRLMADVEVPTEVDVLLAPHHGSRLANTPSFARWAQPEVVIVSGGNAGTADLLRGVYDSARRLFTTHDNGAVSLEVRSDGALEVQPTLDHSPAPDSTPI